MYSENRQNQFNGLTCLKNNQCLAPFQGARQSRALWTRIYAFRRQYKRPDQKYVSPESLSSPHFFFIFSPQLTVILGTEVTERSDLNNTIKAAACSCWPDISKKT
jgi:hypothetical protein